VQPTFTAIQPSHSAARCSKENDMPDDMKDTKKDQGNRVNSPDNRNNTMMTLQRRTLLRTVIRSKTTGRSKTRAASVALPKFSSGSRPGVAGPLFHANFIRNSTFPTCQAISSNDHIVLILMYRRTSFMDITKTYPAKINPAVPMTFRATLNVLIAPSF
jgi:hypothetical protein